MIQWLDSFFGAFDKSILIFYHNLAEAAGDFLSPILRLISFSGEGGILLLSISVLLMLFKKTRRTGVCMFGAICCGALITNLTLKPLICRPRPFEVSELYREFWTFTGSLHVSDPSFPSGHATATTAAMCGLFLVGGKKYLWIGCPYVFLVCASRNYFAVHYPSDVLFGFIIGCASGIIAFLITKCIFAFLEKHSQNKLFGFALNFDLIELFKK